jgi:hypothetical protein
MAILGYFRVSLRHAKIVFMPLPRMQKINKFKGKRWLSQKVCVYLQFEKTKIQVNI